MAKVFPSIEDIKKLKVKPTDGEWFLVNYLIDNFPDEVEIYFQPFLNGDMPDIILMQKDVGVTIIEVKDWNLNRYKLDKENRWYLKSNNSIIKSPFQQVYNYKDNLFNLHINGLLKEKIKNKQFYGRIQPFVYFHNASKNDIENFFSQTLEHYKSLENSCHNEFKSKKLNFNQYENKLEHINNKKSKINRDLTYYAVGNNNLKKINLPKNDDKKLFKVEIYKEFMRYLMPPFHVMEQGIDIVYEKKQSQLIESKPVHQKIKGVAGSGKTVVLAKRAVNAHKRHDQEVLILTYNLTLRSYIHDRISDVRENFGWKYFYITNYHQLISQTLNNVNIEVDLSDVPEHDKKKVLDEKYFSNLNIFEAEKLNISKYKSIFIDEIQDYKPEWIKIIRKYFLEENGEIVLFGDEKQNIYERDIDEDKNSKVVQGFGRWEKLNKSIRHKEDSHILKLAKSFQREFFEGKYEIDSDTENTYQPSLHGVGINKISHYKTENLLSVVESIFSNIRKEKIHPNDVCILSSHLAVLREIDYLIRTKFNERTLTSFETKEMHGKVLPSNISDIRKNKKIGFNLNSGVLKLSTIHSFKGYEAPTIFLIIDENDHNEMIYVGITRAKFNIMIFTPESNKYNAFLSSELEKEL